MSEEEEKEEEKEENEEEEEEETEQHHLIWQTEKKNIVSMDGHQVYMKLQVPSPRK